MEIILSLLHISLRAPDARVMRSAVRWRLPRTTRWFVRARITERDSLEIRADSRIPFYYNDKIQSQF